MTVTARKHDDEVFREKRTIKNPIKFKISLNEEQKAAKDIILKNLTQLLMLWQLWYI